MPAARTMAPYTPRGRTGCTTESIAINGDNSDPTLAPADAIPKAVVRYNVGYNSRVKMYPIPNAIPQQHVPIQAKIITLQLPIASPFGIPIVTSNTIPAVTSGMVIIFLRPNLLSKYG